MRSRWAATGAVVALLVGAGGVLTSSAASSAPAAFVPITPCRLIDTRPGPDNIGTRSTPLGPNDTHVATVLGTNGNCTIPITATGVSTNITDVGRHTSIAVDERRHIAVSYHDVTNTALKVARLVHTSWVAGSPGP